MKVIKITKSGKIFLDNYSAEISDKTSKPKKLNSIKEYLSCEVEFEEGLTFGTFFKLILEEKDFFNTVFSQELNGKSLDALEKEMNESSPAIKDDYSLDFLEVSKFFELISFNKGYSIDLFAIFTGAGKTEEGIAALIPVSFYSLNEIKDVEIVINNVTEIYNNSNDEMFEEIDDEEVEEVDSCEIAMNYGVIDESLPSIEANNRITLYEVIQSIFYEISYFKNKKDRIKARKSQNEQETNKNKMLILEKQLSFYVKNDEFEKAAMIKRDIDKLKLKSNSNEKF